MWKSSSTVLMMIVLVILAEGPFGRTENISHKTVKSWAYKLGFELSQLGSYVTGVQELQDSYKQAEVKPRDGNALVQEIAKDVGFMMASKISAVKRIMDVAETLAETAREDINASAYVYNNAKENILTMTYSPHFGREVNLSYSNFHVPTNVYQQAMNVVQAISWAEKLNTTFINNYDVDPSLSWQYFGSATGFMTQYPAIEWKMEPVDLFDCRTRSWYIEAATSPKDMLILVDISGSMTGIRKEIARHVVNSILDTLGNNDFVNILTFSNETNDVVPCFKDTLVQANLANIRELKVGMEGITTDRIANFTAVLTRAFELLKSYRTEEKGARCNQAIMLITDGVPYNYKEIFQRYNWQDNPEEPDCADMPVRVFTYLIGREVADVREVKWMACANRGYYVKLSTMAEVSEKVLKYVPVMARPLVLQRNEHPVIWTPVYADVMDPKMTDYLWDQKERIFQKERVQLYRKDPNAWSQGVHDPRMPIPRFSMQEDKKQQPYRLMTSVSVPVYNRKLNANLTEQILVNEAYWVTKTRESRIADLLGVAGIDVPITDIERLMLPHMLGVNGYAFIVTNNGYVLTHPDLRPVFDDILKPAYNSVDMAEVELMDQEKDDPRDFETGLLAFREGVVNQSSGNVILHTRYHYDNMQRVGRVRRNYHYTDIINTSFSVVVALPEHDHGGSYRVHAIEETHRYQHGNKAVTDYFAGKNWRVHPDWTYCGYHYKDEYRFDTPEEEVLHFLDRTRQAGWKWMDNKVGSQPPEHSHGGSPRVNTSKVNKDSYYCDRNLLLSLVFDAKVTEWFANPSTTRKEKGKEFQQRFGVTLAFMATHSGLTRWQDFPLENETHSENHFGRMHPRATDEVWYQRAVEQHYVQQDSFVFSVPIDAVKLDHNDTLVTASHAIFIGNGKLKAPAAVVGFQFKYSKLQGLFQNITYSCEGPANCQTSCKDKNLDCYLVDNNGYVVAAEKPENTGKFFGAIDEQNAFVMRSLISEGIFDEIRIYDYQAVCLKSESPDTANDGSMLITPLKALQRAAGWILGQLAWAWAKTGVWSSDEYAYAYSYPGDEDEEQEEEEEEEVVAEEDSENIDDPKKPLKLEQQYGTQRSLDGQTTTPDPKPEKNTYHNVSINRTRVATCDKVMKLYLLQNVSSSKYDVDSMSNCDRPYVVQPVDYSNMILVVVNRICEFSVAPNMSLDPIEVKYNNTWHSLACHKLTNILERRRPSSCIRNHTKEWEIQDQCGGASPGFRITLLTILLSITSTVVSNLSSMILRV